MHRKKNNSLRTTLYIFNGCFKIKTINQEIGMFKRVMKNEK